MDQEIEKTSPGGLCRVLGTAVQWTALLSALLHMLVSFTRHIFTPQNNMQTSAGFTAVMRADQYLAVGCGALALVYVAAGLICRRSRAHVLSKTRTFLSPEGIILLELCRWYIVGLMVHGNGSLARVHGYWRYVTDMCICLLILYPLPALMGTRRARVMLEAALHTVMAVSTVWQVYALIGAFSGQRPLTPGGLPLYFSGSGSFSPGVNPNIGAAISFSMALIALYMILRHRGVLRWVYAAALAPHLFATILSGSRAHLFALLAVLPLTAFLGVMKGWTGGEKRMRIAAAVLSAAAAAGLVLLLRQLGGLAVNAVRGGAGARALTESLTRDSGRLPAWAGTLRMMVSSEKQFFFGMRLGDFPSRLAEVTGEMFGRSSRLAHAHNLILQTGAILGVPAMAAFLVFLVITAVRCVRVGLERGKSRTPAGWFLPVAILGTMVVNMFEPFNMLYISIMGCLFFLFAGWVRALDKGL